MILKIKNLLSKIIRRKNSITQVEEQANRIFKISIINGKTHLTCKGVKLTYNDESYDELLITLNHLREQYVQDKLK